MIVRVQFVEREKYQSIYPWCLFSVENNGTKIGEVFDKIEEGTVVLSLSHQSLRST